MGIGADRAGHCGSDFPSRLRPPARTGCVFISASRKDAARVEKIAGPRKGTGRSVYDSGTDSQAGFTTRPVRMHRVHALTRRTVPLLSMCRTVWRLGYHRRLVLLFAWLTLLPTCGSFPQNSHFLLMTLLSFPFGSKSHMVNLGREDSARTLSLTKSSFYHTSIPRARPF